MFSFEPIIYHLPIGNQNTSVIKHYNKSYLSQIRISITAVIRISSILKVADWFNIGMIKYQKIVSSTHVALCEASIM